MVSAEDIPWEVIIFVSIFAIVLFYFVFFQGYLTAAIYKCIIKCFLPKKLSISFKYIQFSILSGHITIYDLAFANLSMRVEIARLCVALKYWSKVPEFNENDKNDDKLNDKDINNVEWIRSSHEPSETDKANKIKKKKGIFKTIFDRKSRFIVNIDGLHVTLYNQSEDAISRIETFRKIYELEKKTTEEATKIYNEMYPSNPPQAYQLSIIMRVILPLTFKVRGMAITIGNPNLPSTAIITSKKVKGIFTMLKKEDLQHSLKQRITLHMKDVKIRFAPNDEFDKTKFIKDSMRNLDERFELTRTILYTNVLNAIYTQDAYGCYIRSEDKDKAMLATAEPKSSVQVGLMSPIIEYGSYADKLRSAFMRYFKPFLFINPTIYPNSTNRVKYMDITVLFFGEKPSLINLPFTTSQNVNESLIISFDNTPESTIKMILPQYVSTKEENKMEVNCNFIHPKIRTSLSESFVVNKNNQVEAGNDDDETVIIKSSTLLVQYLTYSPEKWYEKGTSECLIHFERCKMRLAPYHIDLLTDLGTDFVSTYPFEPTIDEMDFFQPSEFMVTFKMVDAKIQLLSKSNPRFEEIFRIKNHQRMVIRTPIIRIDLKMPSLVYHEYEKSVSLKVSISSPTFKFFLPNDNMNQFRRNCYKWAHNEADRHGEADTKRNQRFQLRRKFNEEKKSKSKSKEIQTKPKNYNYDDDDDDDDLNVKLNDDEDEDLNENLNDDEFCVEEEDDFDVDFDDDIDENHSDDHFNHKFIKHEYLGCSSIDLIGSYKWNKNNGDKQFPLIVKVGPSNGLISVVCIKSLLAVISNYSSSNKSHPNTDVHNKAFENWVKPKPEFPNSVMHMHINVQIIKADVGIPFDLYDTSAFLSLHAANFFLSVDSYAPYFHVLIGLPSISITFNKTHFPNERFYYERIGSGMIHGNPQEVLHIDGINFAIKNSQVLKPKPLTLFSLMGIDVGDIKGTISIYQLFALLDLALNFTHLWFSFDVAQQLEPDLDSIFLPRQMQVIVRGIFLIVDFVQYGLMMINLPNGIVVYQDNMINKESHKAMFVNIPTIDVHHIYQPSQETGNSMKKKKKRKKKMKTFPRNEKKSSSSSHNKVASLIDSTSSLSNPNKNELEEEEEEDFEEEKIEKIEFLSQLRSVFRFTTYISIIRRGRYNNYDNDSKIQMKYLNEYDPNHQFLDLINLPQNVKLPKIFCNYDATLDDEYTLTKTNKPDPNSDNYYELQIPEIFYSSQKKYPKSDIYQWIHLFQIQRFSSFGSLHKNDSIDQISSELNPNNYIDLRRDMHIIVSSNTKALMNMEYMVVVMLMVKTFKLQPDSHFLSSIARDVVTDLWMKKILKKNNMSLILSNVLISIFDFNREVKLDLNIRNIDYINLNEINVSNEMTLSISDISLNVYSKSDIDPAATLDLSLINLGKINGETSIRIHEIIGKAPYSTSATKMSELPLVKVINYSLSYILPIFKEIESPNVGGGMNDFKQSLERYIDDEENLDVYYHPEAQNDNNNENDDDNNNNNIDDDDYVNIDEDSRNDHHSHHHSHHGSHRKANKVKNHLPKFHVHHKKKNKKKKNSSDESQKEETSTDIFLSKESIVDEERNTSISRYFLAYAKLCNDRKCLMNFVDNVQFDNLENYEEEEEETNANGIDANEIRGNYASRNYHAEAHSEGNNPESIPQIKLDKSEDDIKIDNDIRSYSIKVSRTVIRISIIQFNLLDSVCNIKLDPISLISKGEDFGFRFVIKSIYVDLKEDMFTFISAIKKPKKERVTTPPPSASKKFVTKKKKNNKAKKAKKKFIIHFIFNTLAVKLKVIKLDVKYLSALVNIANPPYASLSLMSLVFGDSDFGMIYMNGFDFNYSKEVNHGSFCLRPIGVKVSLDLLLNPKGCYETGRIDLSKIKRRKKFRKSNMEPEEREQLQTKKTEKIVQNVQKFNQSETKHSIIELLDNISFFFIVNKVKIEATIDRDLSTKFTFPGARGVLFNPKNFKALLYLQKPKIHVTNLLKMALFDVFMYGYYEPFLKQLTVTTMSGDVKVETCQETLTHIAQLINNLLSKRPPKEENKQSASKNQHRNASRKSVANIPLIDNNSSSIAYKSIKSTSKQKNNKKNNDKSKDNLSTNVIKVVNTISSGINVIVRFVMPLITIRLPEIASTLNIVKPMVSVKCQNKMIFDASIHKLDLQVDHSFVSIGINFTKDNEEKTFTMNNLLVVVTPSLFDHIIKMKNFFTTIKQELKSQYFLKLNENFQSTVKSGFNNIIDLDAFSDNKRSKMQNSMKSDLDIPTIINDKYVIIFNNTLINLKLTNEADQVMEKERRKSSANIRHDPTEGFVLNISTIFLCMETRKSEMHNKLATAARFLLENLIFEDKNEKQNSDKTVKSKEFSAVKCEKANISALSFVNHLNVDVSIKSFHISVFPTVPFIFIDFIDLIKKIHHDMMKIKAEKIEKNKISEKKKFELKNRRRSYVKITPKSSYVIFDINVENTAVILNSPNTEFAIPTVSVYGIFEKTKANFSNLKLQSTVRIEPIQMSISPPIIHWFEKLIKNLGNANEVMSKNPQSTSNSSSSVISPSNSPKKHKKAALTKFTLHLTLLVDQIDFNLGCQPSPVMLLFALKKFVTHFTTTTNCLSFQIGEVSLSTDKIVDNRKASFFSARTYRPKAMSHAQANDFSSSEDNTDRLLSIKVAPIVGLFGSKVQAFNVGLLGLSVSNNEMEDFFTFLKVWFEPISDLLKKLSKILIDKNHRRHHHRQHRNSVSVNHFRRRSSIFHLKLPIDLTNNSSSSNSNINRSNSGNNSPTAIKGSASSGRISFAESKNGANNNNNGSGGGEKKSKFTLNIIARVQALSISFGYSGVNGKIGLLIKPILFSNTKLSTNLRIPEIDLTASGFVEGKVQIKPVIFQVNSAASNLESNSPLNVTSNSSSSSAISTKKRLDSVIIINSIDGNIKSYRDPLLSFSLKGIYLFYLLVPQSDQILSLIVDSPKLKMTSQAISKFKRIIASITDPIKDAIINTKRATSSHKGPQTLQPRLNRPAVSHFSLSSSSIENSIDSDRKLKEKTKRKVKIAKARLDLLLEKLQVELYKYYLTDKEAVKATVTKASLTVDLHENLKDKNTNNNDPLTQRNMNFVFYPMSLLRLFCNNGTVIDQRSVLLIPKIIGSLNTTQQNQNVSYDFNTKFSDSVEASLSITDYEAVRAIIMFAVTSLKSSNGIENAYEIEQMENTNKINPAKNNKNKSHNINNNNDNNNNNNNTNNDDTNKKRKFEFTPNTYQFSPQFKIALGAKIQPNVEWVLQMLGIKDDHVIPATLFQYVCVGLQDLLEYIAQTVTND